jgi:predicted phosphoribosyltransferase
MHSVIFKNRIDAGEKLAKKLSWLKQDRLKKKGGNKVPSS